MKCLVLDVFTTVSQEVHAQLQVLCIIHVLQHDGVVRSVQQNLSEKFDALSFRHIVWTREQSVVTGKERIVLVVEEARDHGLVFRKKFPEGGKRIGCYVEGTALDVRKERPE